MLPVAETPVKLDPAIIAGELAGLPQTECPVIHRFADGVYFREMAIPAKTFIVGCDHIDGGINICLQGSGVLFVDGVARKVSAPEIIFAKPGAKMMYTLTDVVWWNVFPNPDNERDIQKLESRIVSKDQSMKLLELAMLEIESDKKKADVASYSGVDEGLMDWLDGLSETSIDIFSLEVRNSAVGGLGLFSPYGVDAGHTFGAYIHDGKKTQLAKYANHSKNPNCELVIVGDAVALVSKNRIHGKLGGMHGEELTIDYQSLAKIKEVLQ